jgi:uncharacterized membrane protein
MAGADEADPKEVHDDEDALDGEVVPVETPTAAVRPASGSPPNSYVMSVQMGIASYASQLPPSSEIRELEAIAPGTLNRLLGLQERVATQTDREQVHRHDMERQEGRRRDRGQLIAAGAFALGMGTTLALALTGNDGAAEIVGGSTVLGSVTVFVTGRVWGGRSEDEDEGD